MRLHRVEITAFGPFAQTAGVDFDHLSEAGLFLLSGPTGAGKTSVLDAVCFALYGDVPGDRSAAKRLRCDQADPSVRPSVTLEVTLGDRRFSLVRSPAWERAKRRGSGTTTEPASVTVSELTETGWQPLSTRLDETGDLVARLLGMSMTQFTQVAMLPQGRFQAFLRARSDDRHRLLQQLFRTGRFEQVERWLRERRLELRRRCDAAQEVVADLVSRLSEATGEPLPDGWDIGRLDGPASDGSLTGWVGERRAAAGDARRVAEAEVGRGRRHELETRAELEAARARSERRARAVAAAAEHAALQADREGHLERQRRLARARRAASVVPLHQRALAAEDASAAAESAADDAVARVAAITGRDLPTLAALDAFAAGQVEAGAALRALRPRTSRLAELAGQITRTETEAGAAVARLDVLGRRRRLVPTTLTDLGARLATAEQAALTAPAVLVKVEQARERLAAQEEMSAMTTDVEDARLAWHESQAVALHCREEWLTVKEARLEMMAAEIAGQLAVGACCPVCGSCEHPAKASPSPEAPDAAREKHALKALDDAKATEHLRELELRDLETRLALLLDLAGPQDRAELGEEVTALTDEARRLEELARDADSLRAELAAAETQAASDDALARHLEAEHAAASAALAALRNERDALVAEVAEALATACGSGTTAETFLTPDPADQDSALGSGLGPAIEAALHRHRTHARAARAAAQAIAERDAARAAYREAREELVAAAAAQGFDDAVGALAASLEEPNVAALVEAVTHHDQRLAAVSEVLAEPGVRELAAADPPEVDRLAEAHAQAMEELAAAQTTAATWAVREVRLQELEEQLASATAAWQPVRDEHLLVAQLTTFVEGKAPDNRLQMRLSAYVLAYRLSQVVAAANLRLARMSDQRFSLEHTAHRGAGETRGGLSLQVRDDWSGESRDPATLSGGETFVVSLALALGLADVITEESDAAAEGSRLETLFVDEGFGSLDADTLDDVMDTLDSLRDGGRVVGVVSHVAELRDRIPTQLLVAKSRQGSTVSVRG